MRPPVLDKRQMYALLRDGAFGNTVDMHLSLAEWQASPDSRRDALWGIRSYTPNDPTMRLDVPTADVAAYATAWFGGRCNITEMVDRWMVFRAMVWDGPDGWHVQGTTDTVLKWREAFETTLRRWSGSAARAVCRHFLTPGSYADVEETLDLWPGHIYEFTACSRMIGRIKGRNAICWECRLY